MQGLSVVLHLLHRTLIVCLDLLHGVPKFFFGACNEVLGLLIHHHERVDHVPLLLLFLLDRSHLLFHRADHTSIAVKTFVVLVWVSQVSFWHLLVSLHRGRVPDFEIALGRLLGRCFRVLKHDFRML